MVPGRTDNRLDGGSCQTAHEREALICSNCLSSWTTLNSLYDGGVKTVRGGAMMDVMFLAVLVPIMGLTLAGCWGIVMDEWTQSGVSSLI